MNSEQTLNAITEYEEHCWIHSHPYEKNYLHRSILYVHIFKLIKLC